MRVNDPVRRLSTLRLPSLALAASALLSLAHAALPRAPSPTPRAVNAGASAQKGRAPRIAPSRAFEALGERKRAQPGVTPAELAAYGNALIARHGFNYHFDSCEIVEANGARPGTADLPERANLYTYPLRPVGGGRAINFQLVDSFWDGLCSECFFYIPALRVTRDRMLVVTEGRRVWLRRPPEFALDEIQLVDASLKRVLRAWEVPYQTRPLGLSADRTRLYIESWELANLEIEDLAVEISDAGARLVPVAQLNLPEGQRLTDFPRDPLNSYLNFKRFGTGRRSYTLRYSEVCT